MRYESWPKEMREENERLAEQYFNQTEIEEWSEFKKQYASKSFIEFLDNMKARKAELLKQGIIED